MLDLIEFLVLGSFLGLAAGTSPGPLLAVTISETLQHGKWEGIKVAVSP
jgi:threonine/homoserine/homoserine lactone efflux protein